VFLNSGELLAEVNKMCDEAKAKGIKGVPTIIIASKWVITGGQSSDVFVKVSLRSSDIRPLH
jgi:predicted DsbA family dithiol-disulfide isomerase